MSAPGDPPMILLAVPGLLMVAIGAGLLFGARALLALQVRMMERQIQWMKSGAGLIVMRLFGGFIIFCGLATFLVIALAPVK